jgi:NadR type nicotinamide-nucleotide adenylyltransferase
MPDGPIRIALFGPESTGKSRLAERLALHFGEPWAPEFVRAFWDARAGRIVAADLAEIARGQIAAEEAAAARARRVMFSDTDLLTNVLWADLLFPGHCPAWVRAEADVRAKRYSLYLFCDTDLPFEPDPQRCFPDPAGRERGRRLWWETLEVRALPRRRIHGDWAQREAQAIAAVSGLIEP